MPRRLVWVLAAAAIVLGLAGCGRKDPPTPPGGKAVTSNVYPKPDAVPGAPPPAAEPPATPAKSGKK